MMSTIIVLLLATCSTINLHGMENKTLTKYQKQCHIIKNTLKTEKSDFLKMVYNKQLDPAQELTRIEQQFTYYKNKLIKEKEDSLLQLKNFHNINDTDWQWCMELTKNICAVTKDAINNSSPNNLHPDVISGESKAILAKYLHMYGLNIQKINIQKNICQKESIQSSCSLIFNNSEPIKITVKDPQIIFYIPQEAPQIATKSELVFSAWIFAHISCANAGLKYSIAKKSNKNCTIDTLSQTKEFIQFDKVQIKQSELLPSLENYEACKWITKQRSNDYSTSIENRYEHFTLLYSIKNLWEKRKTLERLMLGTDF